MTTSPNSCRPSYRGLTPTQECHLRSMRLGIIERPGALPPSDKDPAVVRRAEARKAVLLGHLEAGICTRSGLRTVLHNASWIDGMIETLIILGMMQSLRGKNGSVTYTLTRRVAA